MKIFPLAAPVDFEEFCAKNGIELEAHERAKPYTWRWYVTSPGLEVMHQNFLESTYGNGATPEDARENYKHKLAGNRVVINAYNENRRREIQLPNEWL